MHADPRFGRFEFHTAGQLRFGCGAVRGLGDWLRDRGLRNVFLLSDQTLDEVGLVEQVVQAIGYDISVETCLLGEAEPRIETAVAIGEQVRAAGPQAIVGLGGGSNLALAKIAAVSLAHSGRPADYFGWDNVPGPVGPLVAIPTTSGTGSEVSHSAVLTDTANRMKASTLSQHLRPSLAIVDPELTLTCPPSVTADAGIDALTHAAEAYAANAVRQVRPGGPYSGAHPLGQALAISAIELIGGSLRQAVDDPDDIIAREALALAATQAGMAFSNCGVGAVHAMEYPLGGMVHVGHGRGNGLLLPYVMRFWRPRREAELAKIGTALAGRETTADEAIAAVERLRADIGIPHTLREIGVAEEMLPECAAKAAAVERLISLTPGRPSEEDVLAIYREAL